jgi:hypothetical protein
MAEQLGIVTDFSSIAQDVIVVWYESSNSTAEVGRILKPAAHAAGDVVTVTGLGTTIYTFKFYETSDGTTFGTLLSSWSIQVKSNEQTVTPYHYVVGRGDSGAEWADPAIDGNQINDTRLADAVDLMVFSSVGFRQPWEYTLLPGGGIQLLPGDVFVESEKWTIVSVRKTESASSSGGSGGSTPPPSTSGINLVSADGSFGSGYYAKKNVAGFSGAIGSTSFPAFSTIPNGTRAKFSTFSGSQRYWKLAFSSGDSISVNGKVYNAFYLGKDEWIELEWADGVCYAEYSGRLHQVGNFILANNKSMVGTALCDGSGTEYNISDWQRLIDELPVELKVSYATWNASTSVTVGAITKTYYPNKGKFAVDTGAGKFKFPDLREQTLKSLLKMDGSSDAKRLASGAGGAQAMAQIKHGHRVNTGGNTAGANPGRSLIRQSYNGDGYGAEGTGSGSGGPYIEQVGGNEQLIDNIGCYPLVYI